MGKRWQEKQRASKEGQREPTLHTDVLVKEERGDTSVENHLFRSLLVCCGQFQRFPHFTLSHCLFSF